MTTINNTSTAFLIHISALASYIFPFGGVLAPLIIWQIKKDESYYIDEQGKSAVNFNLSFALYPLYRRIRHFLNFFLSFSKFYRIIREYFTCSNYRNNSFYFYRNGSNEKLENE
jgi:uncharacterized Tic20 family protein